MAPHGKDRGPRVRDRHQRNVTLPVVGHETPSEEIERLGGLQQHTHAPCPACLRTFEALEQAEAENEAMRRGALPFDVAALKLRLQETESELQIQMAHVKAATKGELDYKARVEELEAKLDENYGSQGWHYECGKNSE